MKIAEETVDRAFEAFHQRYVDKETRAWDLDHHVQLWAGARKSVESRHEGAVFIEALAALRSHWQIARGRGSTMLEPQKVLRLLKSKGAEMEQTRLSNIHEGDALKLFRLVNGVADIKRVNGEPSLMAISKVLHFFNPRLFVIVDRAMVWDWTFKHSWLWEPIDTIRRRIDPVVGCDSNARNDAACDIASYVAILVESADMLRENPHVAKQFAAFLRRHTTEDAKLPTDLESYEAAAVEWLLLGLVELPPAGVKLA